MKRFLLLPGILFPLIMSAQVTGRVADTEGRPLAGVGVSDGVQIVKTDASGAYSLDTDKKYGYVFVITPSGYEPVTLDGLTPAFYRRLEKSAGETENRDFVLQAVDQSTYSLMVMTDLHLTNDPGKGDQFAFNYFTGPWLKQMSDNLLKKGPAYCLQLGDLSHDVYWYLMDYDLEDAYKTLRATGMTIPTYSIPGNHENDGAIIAGDNTDFEAGHRYREVLGPEYYSFNVGGDHILMMDNIIYVNTPGEGRKVQGIKGKRNFYTGFTPDQMAFLRADLADLPDSTRIILGTHAPLITGPLGTFWRDKEQMDTISVMFSRFREFHNFAGHVHRQRYLHSDKYGINCTAVTALSGNMWTTAPNKDLGEAGEDAGVVVCDVSADTLLQRYVSRRYGENPFRIYDMNTVGEYYRRSDAVRSYFKDNKYEAVDYSDQQRYRNLIRVNCWDFRPGYSLEIYENGKPLEVRKTEEEDPLFFISFFPVRLAGPFFGDGKGQHKNPHMWEAQASTPDGIIAVWLKDEKGAVVAQRMLRRPIPFGPDMTSDGTKPVPDVSLDTTPCQVRLVQRSSSALVYEFSTTHFTDTGADCDRDWKLCLYSDPECKKMVRSRDLAGFKGFDPLMNPPRICFSGLDPGTRYWCKASVGSAESEAVRGTTNVFDVVTIGEKGTAQPGEILLAENFGELSCGDWYLSEKRAVGDGSGEAPLNRRLVKGTRLSGWDFYSIDNAGKPVDDITVYAHPGYLVCGSVDDGDGQYNTNAIVLSPKLSCLQKGKKATVRVTYRCQKYDASDADLKVYAGSTDGVDFFYDPDKPQYVSTPDIARGSSNGYRSFVVSGVKAGDRIFMGLRPDQTQGKKDGKFTHRRYVITDVTIELIDYE